MTRAQMDNEFFDSVGNSATPHAYCDYCGFRCDHDKATERCFLAPNCPHTLTEDAHRAWKMEWRYHEDQEGNRH